MKNIIILCDGMADLPIQELNGKTPMQTAIKHNMDYLGKSGVVGLVNNVPRDMEPGSDIANMSVLGYNPEIYYKGRSSLEAEGMGIEVKEGETTFRANLVTLSEDEPFQEKIMKSYCSGDISNIESKELIKHINSKYSNDFFTFFPGVSYRNCIVSKNTPNEIGYLTPPYDISNKKINDYLPSGKNANYLNSLMKSSYEFLKDNIINKKRLEIGLLPANALWIWGEGKKTKIPQFKEKYKIDGIMVTAVDLLKGLGKLAGLEVANVEGVTGYIDTNYEGKAKAAIDALKQGKDFAFIHIEAPDECGHRQEMKNKILSIELIDKYIVAPVIQAMKDNKYEYKIMILPDHPTPVSIGKHTHDPVPFLIYSSIREYNNIISCFCEAEAQKTGINITDGYGLMDKFMDY